MNAKDAKESKNIVILVFMKLKLFDSAWPEIFTYSI